VLVSGDDVSEDDGVALLYITWVGLGLSLLCLVLTALVILSVPDMRSSLRYQILLNLVLALGASQMLFFFITEPTSVVTCKAVSATLMYTLLALFGWMSVEAFHLYRTFVNADVWDVGRQATTQKRRMYSALAWGLPVLCVAVCVIVDSDGMISTVDVRAGGVVIDSTIEYCWFDKDGLARWFFLVPMLLSVTINFFVSARVFVKVRAELNRRRKRGVKGLSERAGATVDNIKLMFMVGSATGVGWLLAILVLFQIGGTATQYLFTVANAFQGCLIFYFHVVSKEEGRLVFMTMKARLSSLAFGSRSTSSKKGAFTRGMRQASAPDWSEASRAGLRMPRHTPWKTTTAPQGSSGMYLEKSTGFTTSAGQLDDQGQSKLFSSAGQRVGNTGNHASGQFYHDALSSARPSVRDSDFMNEPRTRICVPGNERAENFYVSADSLFRPSAGQSPTGRIDDDDNYIDVGVDPVLESVQRVPMQLFRRSHSYTDAVSHSQSIESIDSFTDRDDHDSDSDSASDAMSPGSM
jgi:hypothetical protein